VLNEAIPKTRAMIDVGKLSLDDARVAAVLDAASDAAVRLGTLRHSTALPGPLRDLVGITKRNRVKRDLYNFTADALCGDITAALVKYRATDRFKLTHRPLEGFKRLLIVLDDFEATAPVLGDFVVSALLRRLAAAPFPTVIFIACRDDLEAIHPGFGQHAKRWLAEHVQLQSFDLATAFDLMTEAKIPAETQPQFFAISHGLPYLLSLVIEEATASDSDSALFAKKFFDRTTRWMTDLERDWFTFLCYLDVVNEDTIAAMTAGTADPAPVQRWFERESSIRDPLARVFTVRPLVREKSLQYLATRSPTRHRAMMDRALGINQASSQGA
jgi:hypothetical protein